MWEQGFGGGPGTSDPATELQLHCHQELSQSPVPHLSTGSESALLRSLADTKANQSLRELLNKTL